MSICCNLDGQIKDKMKLYELLSKTTKEMCYFESSDELDPKSIINIFKNLGFINIIHLNILNEDDIKRQIFIIDKKIPIIKLYDREVFLLGNKFIKQYPSTEKNIEKYNNIKNLYKIIEDCPYIPKTDFSQYLRLFMEDCGPTLDKLKLRSEDKEIVKKQIIELIIYFNNKGIAHGDLHSGNICFKNNIIKVIDFDTLFVNNVELLKCYDIMGGKEGLNWILRNHPQSIKHYLCPIKISLEDFFPYQKNIQIEEYLEEMIYKEMVEISGPYTKHTNNNGLLYASFHFDKFNKLKAQRNTLTRFSEFGIKDDLSGYKVFDFGSNTGGLSFEFIRRKADFVYGFEYCQERVNICKELANYLGVEKSCRFASIDLDKINNNEFKKMYGECDISICCALDLHVKEKMKLYKLIAETTKETCYFESNDTSYKNKIIEIFKNLGFENITHLGVSKTDGGIGRQIYVMNKKKENN